VETRWHVVQTRVVVQNLSRKSSEEEGPLVAAGHGQYSVEMDLEEVGLREESHQNGVFRDDVSEC
jgi:hypothetical protein